MSIHCLSDSEWEASFLDKPKKDSFQEHDWCEVGGGGGGGGEGGLLGFFLKKT